MTQFAQVYFGNTPSGKAWLTQVSDQLLEQGGYQVVATIEALEAKTEQLRKEKAKLLGYYQKNSDRMDSPSYLRQGWMIGSGAIEAAQRTVAQQRLKLSGQRWGKKGAQKVLDLRALNMSDRWYQLQDIMQKAA